MSVSPALQRELLSLLDYPNEDLATEIKDWLDLGDKVERANVARELIALANNDGGQLLFGFEDTPAGWEPSGACPFDLKLYSQDEVNNVLKRHAEPAFECSVVHLSSTAGTLHVIIRVPGGHTAPIRSRGGPEGSRLTDHCYYIRRRGPESAPPDSGSEWDELITRCVNNNRERQLEAFRRIVELLRSSPETAQSIADLASGAADPLAKWASESVERLRRLEGSDDG
jgi:predicted HTH transcriptional regulator